MRRFTAISVALLAAWLAATFAFTTVQASACNGPASGATGSGAMGSVYLARLESMGGRTVALKVLHGPMGRAGERFLEPGPRLVTPADQGLAVDHVLPRTLDEGRL